MTQDIKITPGSGEPQILFRGSGANDTAIELNVLSSYESATGSGTAVVFDGTQGRLLSITDNLSSGTIFSVSNISGLPLIAADASGNISINEYGSGVTIYSNKGLTLPQGAPSSTSNSLYNVSGILYFDGSSVGAQSDTLQLVTDRGATTTNSILINGSEVQVSGDNVSNFANDAGYLTVHPVISAASSSDNSGRTYIQDIILDSNGHVTGIATATETVVNTDTTYTAGSGVTLNGTTFDANVDNTVQTTAPESVTSTASRTYAVQTDASDNLVVNVPWSGGGGGGDITAVNAGSGLSGGGVTGDVTLNALTATTAASGITILTNTINSDQDKALTPKAVNDAGYLTAHPNISAASSSDNSGRTYIQDILLDSNGHVTGIATAAETVTDTTYTAGTGLSLDGTEFNIDATVIQSGDNISLLNNDAGYLTAESDTLEAVIGRGSVATSDFTASGLFTAVTGVELQANTPATTTNKLYNVGGVLHFNGSGVNSDSGGAGGSTSPSGADTYVQFNNSGEFGGDPDFTWNSGTSTLKVGGTPGKINIAGVGNGTGGELLIEESFGGDQVCRIWDRSSGATIGAFELYDNNATNVYLTGGGTGGAYEPTSFLRNGSMVFGRDPGTETPDYMVEIQPEAVGDVALVINTIVSQAADMQQWNDSNGNTMALVDVAGNIETSGYVRASSGVLLDEGTPASTTNTIYNVGGTLYFNGSALSTSAGSGLTIVNNEMSISGVPNALLDNSVKKRSIQFVSDGGGSVLTTGVKSYVTVPYDCTVQSWTILAENSGSVVVDVWKDTYANYPPTVADTIAGTEKPTISSGIKNQDNSLITWTTALSQGDVLGFNIDSVTDITKISLSIDVEVT